MRDKKLLLLALIATIAAVILQEYNIYSYHGLHPSKSGMITSADEYSYTQPAEQFLENGVWSGCSSGITCYYQRPPGYSYIYLFCKLVFPSNPWIILKIIQIAGFFFSIILFKKILEHFRIQNRLSWIFTMVYAFVPCFSGFIYFTITEGITPFFMLLSIFSWLKFSGNPTKKNLLFYVLTLGFFLLIRPQLLIFAALFNFYFIVIKQYRLFLLGSLSFLPLIVWNIRTMVISGEFSGLHPIYSYQNNTLFRPSHEKMTNLFRIWEHDGVKFHHAAGVLAYDTSAASLQIALSEVPGKYQQEVKPVFRDYQLLSLYQKEKFPNRKPIPGIFEGEKQFNKKIENLTEQLKNEHWAAYYFKTPFNSFRELALSSHLNLKVFQLDFRGNIFVELLRYICLLLVLSCICVPFLLIFNYRNPQIQALALGIFILVFYLVYVQRINEERYITPILPVGLILCAYMIKLAISKFRRNDMS